MFNTKKSLGRRTFLRGAGTLLALPLLDSMIPASTALAATPAKPVRRFGAAYVPHGAIMANWTPIGSGTGFEFSPILKSLEPFRERVVVVSGLVGAPSHADGGHAIAPSLFLSGHEPKHTEGTDIEAATTLDQIIAKSIGQDTLFPSIEIATEDFSASVGACETGYSCAYMNTISWSTPTTPLPMEVNPRVVFERMFGGSGTPAQRAARMQGDHSILDSVVGELAGFRTGLGAGDRTRLNEYTDNIREIERRIQKAEKQSSENVSDVDAPIGPPERHVDHVALMFDLMAAAFESDITRVFSFMMLRDVSSVAYPEIGISEGHHALSHRPDLGRPGAFTMVNTYNAEMYSKFLAKMQATKDGDGTLLDNSLLVYGSGMSKGAAHNHRPLPMLVAGGASGNLKGGRHLVQPYLTPIGNLHIALAEKCGVHLEKFGNSDGIIAL